MLQMEWTREKNNFISIKDFYTRLACLSMADRVGRLHRVLNACHLAQV